MSESTQPTQTEVEKLRKRFNAVSDKIERLESIVTKYEAQNGTTVNDLTILKVTFWSHVSPRLA